MISGTYSVKIEVGRGFARTDVAPWLRMPGTAKRKLQVVIVNFILCSRRDKVTDCTSMFVQKSLSSLKR